MTCDFTLQHYRDILYEADNCDYTFLNFTSALSLPKDNEGKYILLRHDVDQHLDPVMDMLYVEGCVMFKFTATYFLRTRAKQYNLASHGCMSLMRSIDRGGNDIGLHIDGNVKNVDDELELFNRILHCVGVRKQDPTYITQHDPDRSRPISHPIVVDRNVMAERGWTYISDSSHAWRDGCLCEHIKKGTKRIYVTIHPMWWYVSHSGENY